MTLNVGAPQAFTHFAEADFVPAAGSGDARSYPDTLLFVAGEWRQGRGGSIGVINPATGYEIGHVAAAAVEDLDDALEAAALGFQLWRRTPAVERCTLMRRAAELLRTRAEGIARIMTLEQGKPLAQSRAETLAAADLIDWFAEEGRRTYGRIIPSRSEGVVQTVTRSPIGPVAAFTPWNFPINQAVRKVSAALAAGCSILLKGPEETPASCAELVRAFADAGLPEGVLNLVFGKPAQISNHLIPHPVIRKVSFTGSTAVGKQLAALAGSHMKPVTMELGGHAPAIVFEDADLDRAVAVLAANKFRNAGQVCVAPTRFLIQRSAYDAFVDRFCAVAEALPVGDGLDAGIQMGPLANGRRLEAMEDLVQDAVQNGARLLTGGERIGGQGNFFAPTVLVQTPRHARAMIEEPFGPLALIAPFEDMDDAIIEANRLSYGLAAYVYARAHDTVRRTVAALEVGMVGVNHHGLGLPETPFGGVKDSGFGVEGGPDALDAYTVCKFVSAA